jgi:hypothetical protein
MTRSVIVWLTSKVEFKTLVKIRLNFSSMRASYLVYVHHNLRVLRELQSLRFFDPAVVYNDEVEDDSDIEA